MDQPFLEILGKLLLVLGLVGANGFFVAAEFGLVAVRRTRVEQLVNEGNALARDVRHALDHLDNYIAATQLGITLSSLALGWVGEPAVASWIEPWFVGLPGFWPQLSAHAIAVAIAFAIITTLHIILGELVPKSIALQRSEATSLVVTRPLNVFNWIFGPFIRLMNGAGNMLIRLIGLQPTSAHQLLHSEDELRMLVTASQAGGILEASEEEMIHKVFSFADKEAKQLMVPRTEIVAVPADMTLQAYMKWVAEERVHTRFPVYEQTLDGIVGIVHVKDVVTALASGRLADPVRSVTRPVLVVPESIHTDELLRLLRRRRTHMAVLVDEYGGTAGLVTMEDLLEEIVGEIRDEFDEAEVPELADRHDGTWSVDGMLSIDEFNERFGLEIEDPNYETIAGYVMGRLGRLAEVGDEVAIDGLVLRVEALDGRRIATLRVVPSPGRTLVVNDDDLDDEEALAEREPPRAATVRQGTGTEG
jgi:CBS domain containing-hemolysin-like protein